MTKINVPPVVDFWAQAHFKQLTNGDNGNPLATSIRARDFQRVITNVIQPLLRDIGTPEALAQQQAYERMQQHLHDVARRNDPNELAEFPPDGGKQLIADRLDGIEAQLRRLNAKLNYVEIDADGENIFIDFRTKAERRAAA